MFFPVKLASFFDGGYITTKAAQFVKEEKKLIKKYAKSMFFNAQKLIEPVVRQILSYTEWRNHNTVSDK